VVVYGVGLTLCANTKTKENNETSERSRKSLTVFGQLPGSACTFYILVAIFKTYNRNGMGTLDIPGSTYV
jgi:hypothetical protein